jgi:hypothetical protein
VRSAVRFACERCSTWPPKNTTSPGSSSAGRSRPAYLAATGVKPLRDSSGSSAPSTAKMPASRVSPPWPADSSASGYTGSFCEPGVIHRQPFSVSARSSASQAPISVSGSVMMWNESWW